MSDRNKVGLLMLVIICLSFTLATFLRWQWANHYQGQWGHFDSQNYFQQDSFPDGFRFEYPQWWDLAIYPNGLPPNIGAETRIQLSEPYSVFVPSSSLKVYWRRADGNWNLDSAVNWYVNDVARLNGPEERDLTRTLFQPVTVGRQELPGQFLDGQPSELVYVVVSNDEAFAFVCYRCASTHDELSIFQRIIDTVEIYQ